MNISAQKAAGDRLLVVYADLDGPALDGFRTAVAGVEGTLEEIFLTYNSEGRAVDGLKAPLDIVDAKVFDGFHRQAYEWQASLPSRELSTGENVADVYTYPDGDIATHGLWMTRVMPNIQARYAVIETVLTACGKFNPDRVCVFGLPRQQAWIVPLAKRAVISRGVQLVPVNEFLPDTLMADYALHIDEIEEDVHDRRDQFADAVLSRERARVERLNARLLNTTKRVLSTHARLRSTVDQNLARAEMIQGMEPDTDLLNKMIDMSEEATEPDVSTFENLSMIQAALKEQQSLLSAAGALKPELKSRLVTAKNVVKAQRLAERDARSVAALERAHAAIAKRDAMAELRAKKLAERAQLRKANIAESKTRAELAAQRAADRAAESQAKRYAVALVRAERAVIRERFADARADRAAEEKAARDAVAALRATRGDSPGKSRGKLLKSMFSAKRWGQFRAENATRAAAQAKRIERANRLEKERLARKRDRYINASACRLSKASS